MPEPRLPRWVIRALETTHPEAIVGDLYEEYHEHVLPARGAMRARLWFWRHVATSLVVGWWQTRRRRPAPPAMRDPRSIHPSRGTPRGEFMHTLFRDVRYGLRMLIKTPGLSIVAVLTIATGVGLTTHTFSIVYGSVVRGLPYEGADRLMALHTIGRDGSREDRRFVPVHDYVDWRAQQTRFEDLGGYYQGTVNLADDVSRPQRYQGTFITASGLRQVGVQPVLGRLIRDEEDFGRLPPTIILGHHVWQNRYGGEPDIIGKTIFANARAVEVIGVMPPGFRFPFFDDLWLPMDVDPSAFERGTPGISLTVIGRRRPGVSVEAASAEIEGLAQRLATVFPESNEGIGAFAWPFADRYMPQQLTAVLWIMLAAVFGVLLIACANVANLLLARATVRTKEVAIRTALGAGRAQVVRQLLIESLVVATVGGAVGIALSGLGLRIFNAAIVDIQKPFWIDIRLDAPAMAFAIGLTLIASLVSGIVPALRASGAGLHAILKDESRGSSSLRVGKFSTALVVGEIAVSAALLIAAGLMVKSVVNLRGMDMGFTADNVFTARIALTESEYPDAERRLQFWEEVVAGVEASAGVEAAALTSGLPGLAAGSVAFGVEGVVYQTDRDYPVAHRALVSPGFFGTFDVDLREGRDFAWTDRPGSVPVAIVNRSFAERYLAEGPVIGQRIRLGRSTTDQPWLQVVGVVPDLHVGGGGVGGLGSDQVRPEMLYQPFAQNVSRFMAVVARGPGDPRALGPRVQDVVAGLDPNLPIYFADTVAGAIESNTWAFGVFGSLFAIFGGVALFMSAVGLYGVMAFSVSRRTQEMGIRMALGAQGGSIVRLVLRKGVVQLGVGLAAGIGLGIALSGTLRNLLFEVDPADPIVAGLIILTLGTAGLLASIIPARRATRIDLVDALRPE